MGVIIFIMQFAILRVSLHATPQALGYNTGTTNNMGTKIDIIKKTTWVQQITWSKSIAQAQDQGQTSPVIGKVEINSNFKLLYLPSGEGRPSDRRRDTVDWRKPPENNLRKQCLQWMSKNYTAHENKVCTKCENTVCALFFGNCQLSLAINCTSPALLGGASWEHSQPLLWPFIRPVWVHFNNMVNFLRHSMLW